MLRFRFVSTAVAVLIAAGAAEDSCPAGGGGGAKCTAAAAEVAHREKREPVEAKEQQKADLITQELQELTAMKQICKDRIELLEELRKTLNSGANVSLPASHMKMLQAKLPLMSEIVTTAESTPAGSADDYVFSKASIHQQDPVSFVKFLPVRPKGSPSAAPSAPGAAPGPLSTVLVAAQADGNVRLFSPSGELVAAFSAGHDQPLLKLAVSQSMEDSMIITADAGGLIRVHKVNVRSRRQPRRNATDPKVEKVSQYLESQLNVTAQFHVQMQAPAASGGEPCQITALAVGPQQGGKAYLAGDAEGSVSLFSRNGTFTARIHAAIVPGAPVEKLVAQHNSLLFHVGHDWGWINLDKLDAHHVECPGFEGRVSSLVVDSQKSSRLLVADEEGTVWAFNVKEKKKCKVEHSFPKGTTRGSLDIASVDGFAIALERASKGSGAASVLAINMSHLGKGKEAKGAPSAVAWRRGLAAVRDWAVLKRYNQGDLIALLSEDGHEVEVLELLMVTHKEPKDFDSFSNFKMPVIGVAVVLVLGYQYMKNKDKFSGGGGGGDKGNGKFDKFDSAAFEKLSKTIGQKKKEKAESSGGAGLGSSAPRSFGPK